MNSPGSGVKSLKSFTSKKGKLCQLVEALNFTAASIPYGNQVHHVLNNSSLHKGIDGSVNNLPAGAYRGL